MSVMRHSFVTVIALVFAATAAHAQGAVDRAAEVNGKPIMAADVDAKLGNNLAKLQEQMFSLRQQQLDAMIDQKLLEDEAAKRAVTIAALVQSEITSHVTPVTGEEAAKFYDENKSKLQGDLKSLEEQIKNFLNAQRLQARQQEFLKSLRASAKINVFLTPPPTFRSEVVTSGAPVRGASDAPVTIVEFSDFHCPFCRKVQPVLDELRAKYGDKVKLVYRDFPLDSLHSQARAAAEAAHCAIEQGKFWEFHDKLFKNDPDASQATLDRFAQEAGMDVNAFEACRAAGKYKTSVQASAQEGAKLGITGTPTFFINGRTLVGAQPLDAFARVIDEELAAVGPRQSAGSR
jgi:protein-disulfide isomerase